MTWISNLLSRYWRNFYFIVIFLLCLIMIIGGTRMSGYLSEALLWTFYQPFFKIRTYVEELSAVNDENQRLRQSLVDATLHLSELDETKRENTRLRSVLGFEPPPGYRLLPARVLSVSGERRPVSAVINRGENDSVFVNQTLINQQGLIGRVFAVTPGYSTVQLLTDPAARVAVRVAESREMGIVKFLPSQGMILDNFPVQGRVNKGNRILSSGLGGIYPAGLLVGTVASVERTEGNPFCRIVLEEAANFSSLEELFILRPEME